LGIGVLHYSLRSLEGRESAVPYVLTRRYITLFYNAMSNVSWKPKQIMSTASSLSAPCILLMIRQRFIFLFFSDGCINLCCQVACLNNKPAYHRTVLNVMLIDVVCVHLTSTSSHFPTNRSLLKKPLFSIFCTFSPSKITYGHEVIILDISRNSVLPCR